MTKYDEKLFGLDPDNHFAFRDDDTLRFGAGRIRTFSDFIWCIKDFKEKIFSPGLSKFFFSERGERCEVLRLSEGRWVSGRFRLRLEFIPDNPEDFEKPSSSSPSDPHRNN
ncbi:MAG: KGK domain-containing protein [Nostoc sp.]|uniref:KGK domain-containing protein n=1 Tax=Nostoc sp. TaxID=1180 RepID=UPI002FF69FB2